MVFFSCDGCGETLKKAQVDKHVFKCRNGCHSVSCVDCSLSFYGDDYRAHTSCISEAERFEKILYRGKAGSSKKQSPQEAWMALLSNASSTAPSSIQSYMTQLSSMDNVPRKEKAFRNFASNSLKLRGRDGTHTVNEIWKHLCKIRDEKNNKREEGHEKEGISRTNVRQPQQQQQQQQQPEQDEEDFEMKMDSHSNITKNGVEHIRMNGQKTNGKTINEVFRPQNEKRDKKGSKNEAISSKGPRNDVNDAAKSKTHEVHAKNTPKEEKSHLLTSASTNSRSSSSSIVTLTPKLVSKAMKKELKKAPNKRMKLKRLRKAVKTRIALVSSSCAKKEGKKDAEKKLKKMMKEQIDENKKKMKLDGKVVVLL